MLGRKARGRAGAAFFRVVGPADSFDNFCDAPRRPGREEPPMDIIFSVISVGTFWRILEFFHFVLALALLALLTLQSVTVVMPARQTAGGRLVDRAHPIPVGPSAGIVVVLYVLTFLLGAWIYIRYRTYVRIPMEQVRFWWTLGSFEFKEHVMSMGIGLLPAYWYFWRAPAGDQNPTVRRWLTVFLAFTIWYAFVVGHVANAFRGV
jgi:hypothetical protein